MQARCPQLLAAVTRQAESQPVTLERSDLPGTGEGPGRQEDRAVPRHQQYQVDTVGPRAGDASRALGIEDGEGLGRHALAGRQSRQQAEGGETGQDSADFHSGGPLSGDS